MTRRLLQDTSGLRVPNRPRPGDVLQGKYRIERVLGSGGWGVVYEARHLVMTERRFAIKWLVPPEGDETATRRFAREARIASRIRHPHVVDVYDIYLEDSGCFFVMELLEGESLGALLRREGRLAPDLVCSIFLDCLAGLEAAHAGGVIHRDIKPDNIFLCWTSEPKLYHPKLLDFGISRIDGATGATQSTETRSGTVMGTPAYMAPEQVRGSDVDFRTDVYALGVTLHEALSGQRAFQARTYPDLVLKIVTGNSMPLRAPGLPDALKKIVARAMHCDPDQRFPTVLDFATALRRVEPLTASSAVSRRRRTKAVYVVAAIGGAAAVGTLLYATSPSPAAPAASTQLTPDPASPTPAKVPRDADEEPTAASHPAEQDPAPAASAQSNLSTPAGVPSRPKKRLTPRASPPPQPGAPAAARPTDPERTQPPNSADPVQPTPPAQSPRPKPAIVLDGI